jgi:catechol 2,3-dioxygenase
MARHVGFTTRRAGHVVLRVSDMTRSQGFLELVGFEFVGYYKLRGDDRFVLLSSQPVSNHHMVAIKPGEPGERHPEPARHIGLVRAGYQMRDVAGLRGLYQRLGAGADAFGAKIVATEDRGNLYSITCSDPDGNYLEFYARTPADAAATPPYLLRGTAAAELSSGPAGTGGPRSTSHFVFRCADLGASRAFHERALGLRVVAEDERGRLYLSTEAAPEDVLVVLEAAERLDVPRPQPKRVLGAEHVSFELRSFEELRTAYHHLVDAGVTIDHTVDHGVTQSVYFLDPDGNVLEVYHDVPRAEYRDPAAPFSNYGDMREELAGSVGPR